MRRSHATIRRKAEAEAKVLERKILAQFPDAQFRFVQAPGEEECWRLEVWADVGSAYDVLDYVSEDISRILRDEDFSIYVTVGTIGKPKRKLAAAARRR